ncbi:MAG TPA: alpha-2-macroglobulin family protein, partial [Puia sp.]|nr:alpha-2-macroglobulin family protein [Puia sp.]
TDAQGYVHLEKKKDAPFSSLLLEITIPGDHYFPTAEYVSDYYYPPGEGASPMEDAKSYETRHMRGYLFTDRKIYRPGQIVFFKGIEVTEDAVNHKDKPVTGDTVKLLLLNASERRVDSLVLTSNAFGSYHGSFRLPENRRNGLFFIRQADDHGSTDFSVEEYKRPKFYVGYEKQKGVYRVGDSIRVTGFANGYAGNGIDGATVVYRVMRKANFPYSWMFRRRPMSSSQEELQHGEMRTDGQGKFTITFYASPDRSVPPDTKPEYDYEISADVTDINEETRSAQMDIFAGYSVIRLAISLPSGDHRPADSVCRVQIDTTNLSGEPVGAKVHLTLYPLQAPQRLIRSRLWSAPDRFVLSEREFLDSFPHDEYREENNPDSWEKGKLTWDQPTSIPDSGKATVTLTGGYLPAGWYLLEASSVDAYGQTVVDKQIFELYDGKTGKPVNPQYVWESSMDRVAQPGETVSTAIGSSASNVFVVRTVERQEKKEFSHFTLDQERKNTPWAITEGDRGGFGVLDIFVRDNRVFSQSKNVAVPWTNKQLTIRYASYRDKTQPGSKEQWKMTIKGARGEQVSAEVLAAMYDASLDQFAKQTWYPPFLYPSFHQGPGWSIATMFGMARSQSRLYRNDRPIISYIRYDRMLQPTVPQLLRRGNFNFQHDMNPDVRIVTSQGEMFVHAEQLKKDIAGYDAKYDNTLVSDSMVYLIKNELPPAPPVQPRKDFRETAFFFPDLLTDSAGNVTFSFTMPEALTSWKWMTLAHTRDLAFGYAEKTVITQKELMVQPNAPRFLREGDRMELPVKLVNLTDSEMTGQIHLQLTDPTTGQTADGWFTNRQANQYFTVPAHQSVMVGFPLDIPYQYNRPLTYNVTAEARNYSDGEEATLPVVSNRLLVTESLPLNMPGDGTKQFRFDKLLKSGSSETLNHHALTVEFTANPAWYAVQALPYLMEYPYECAEQVFDRAYANALATSIVANTPRLKQVFEKWRTADSAALLSNLQKNPELKSVLLEETPWVLQGKSEEQQKKNIALLFDLDRMSRELESAIDKLSGMQSPDGGFPWFKGGIDDRYITQYILAGIGHLQRLKAIPPSLNGKVKAIVAAALPWLDAQVRKDYEEGKVRERTWAKRGDRPVSAGWISQIEAHYLYMRSMFPDYGIPGDLLPALSYYRRQAKQNWVPAGKYTQGMIALALFRTGDVQTAKDILASLKQTALHDEEKGMYWKGMETGYYWYQAPVEIQSLLIEAFREISGDAGIVRDLKTWLLRQKQTHNWATTKATADACYALLLGGQDWLNAERDVAITLGNKKIDWSADGSGEAGTGYNKKVFDAPFVNPSMGNITVAMETRGGGAKPAGGSPAWGAVYWQYFDMLDKITPPGQGKTALRIEKKLFVARNTDHGPVLESIPDNGSLKPGDKVVVRIVITADRDLEYVHMKDMRAACFEPVNVISQYKWQDGLGYYESTKDAATDFFFGWLPKGTHVFEYPLFTGQSGNFSNGVTTIECMYAPEFAYHSEGIRVNVEAAP